MTENESIEKRLAALGVNLNHQRHRDELSRRDETAKQQAKRDAHHVENPQVSERMLGFINRSVIVAVGFTSVLFSVVLFGLFLVETVALVHGLSLILRTWEAWLLGPVLLGALYTVMFLAETVRPNSERTAYRNLSARVFFRELAYLVGASPLQRIEYPVYAATRTVERALAFVVVLISVVGRLSPILEQTAGMSVVDGLQLLRTETSLIDLLAAFAVGAATVVAIASSHFLYGFVYRVFQNATGGIDLSGKSSGGEDSSALYERYSMESRNEYLTNLLNMAEAKHEKQTADLPPQLTS